MHDQEAPNSDSNNPTEWNEPLLQGQNNTEFGDMAAVRVIQPRSSVPNGINLENEATTSAKVASPPRWKAVSPKKGDAIRKHKKTHSEVPPNLVNRVELASSGATAAQPARLAEAQINPASSPLLIADCEGDDVTSPHRAKNRRTFNVDGIEVEVEMDHGQDEMGCAEAMWHGDFSQMSEMAHQMAQNAEDFIRHVWLRGWTVVNQHSLPQWLQDNTFLIKWHRPELKSFRACFNSIFRLHSETGNIWTHLLGCVAFLAMTVFMVVSPNDYLQWQEKVIFGIFFVGAIICLFCSFLFHTVFCHSENVGRIFAKLDYCGIAFLTMGSFVPYLHYSFYCQTYVKLAYLVTIFILGHLCIVVSMFDRFAKPRFRPLRAAVFIMLGLSGVIPAMHYVALNGIYNAFYHASLGWLILMAVLYIAGALIYAMQTPERFCPGRMDLGCQSHQIFHICVVIAAFVHYHGSASIAYYRLTIGDCPLTLVG